MAKIGEQPDWKWWIEKVVVPVVLAGLAAFLSYQWSAEKHKRTLLPVAPNPATNIDGAWDVLFWDEAPWGCTQGSIAAAIPIERIDSAPPGQRPFNARLEVDGTGPTFSAIAIQGDRTWLIEGYIDADAILYIYKDKRNARSFGSAFLRRVGQAEEYRGIWSGSSPEFDGASGRKHSGPFVTSGFVKWTRP